MIYYHVSTDITHDGKFKPRIPSVRHQEMEDAKTLRISVAPTIEDCLTAIPNGGSALDELSEHLRGYFLVFTIDTDKLGIKEEDIISSEVLFQEDKVRDSEISNEVWITTPFNVPAGDWNLIKVTDWDEESVDVISHEIYELADEKYDGDYLRCYMEEVGELVPSSVKITNLSYHSSNLKKGDVIEFDTYDDGEKNVIQMEAAGLPVTFSDDDLMLCMQAEEDVDVWLLFEEHARTADLIL